MSTTGAVLPRSASTLSESGWTGNAWLTPENLYGAGAAAITAATFDQGVHSQVLRGYAYDLSVIPDGSTIDGVQVVVGGAYYANGGCNLSMLRLLTSAGSQAGSDRFATPVTLTGSAANYTAGSAGDKWGNALDAAWVKNGLFGVALGVIVNSNNCDVFVDNVTMEVWYTAPAAQNYEQNPAENLGVSDSVARFLTIVRPINS